MPEVKGAVMDPSLEQVLSYRGTRESAFRRRSTTRTVLLILIVLLGAGVLLVLGPSFILLASLAFSHTIDEPEARSSIAALAGGAGNVPGSLRVVKAASDDAWDGSTYWYKLSVSPTEMDAFKQNVRRDMMRFPANV